VLARLCRGFSLRSGLRVHIENICTSKDCLESANLNTWNSFDFFIRLLGKRTFLESGEKE